MLHSPSPAQLQKRQQQQQAAAAGAAAGAPAEPGGHEARHLAEADRLVGELHAAAPPDTLLIVYTCQVRRFLRCLLAEIVEKQRLTACFAPTHSNCLVACYYLSAHINGRHS